MSHQDLYNELNSQQQQVIDHRQGPLMVVAGPGTGKTKTLTTKVATLLKESEIYSILVLTFTHKAVEEIRRRLGNLARGLNSVVRKDSVARLTINTFHGLGYQLQHQQVEQPNLISQPRQAVLVKQLINDNKWRSLSSLGDRELLLLISKSKNQALDHHPLQTEVEKLVAHYQQQLHKMGVMDFDDLLLTTVQLVQQSPADQIQKLRYDYVLVDEFQDTNDIQYQLLKLLITDKQNLIVIGDPRQAIYGFRGAQAQAFEQFKQDFPQSTNIILEKNYRSCSQILQASDSLYPQDQYQQVSRTDEGEVAFVKTFNEYTEADWIVRHLSQQMGGIDLNQAGDLLTRQTALAGSDNTTFADFAVVYRLHGLSRLLEKQFRDSGIPFQVIGGSSLYHQSEVALMIDCFHWLASDGEEHLLQLVESSWVGLTKSIRDKISGLVLAKNISTHQAINHLLNLRQLSTRQVGLVTAFRRKLERIKALEATQQLVPLVDKLKKIFDLESQLKDQDTKQANLVEFSNSLIRFNQSKQPLKEFLEYYQRLAEQGFFDHQADKVTLLSMHAAKGLEFDYVYICGFEEGLIPFSKQEGAAELAEERRLLYVAITRAKKGCYLLTTQQRQKRTSTISQFAQDLLAGGVTQLKDEVLEKMAKKQRLQQEKKRQASLF